MLLFPLNIGSGKITLYQPINLYRKFTAQHIFNGHNILPPQSVLITTVEGIISDIVHISEAGDGIEFFDGLLTPGFINAHCHIELSYLKGKIATGTGLVSFVQEVMKSRGVPDDGKQPAMQLAEQELYDSGTVAVGDICNTIDSIELKQTSKLHWHNFIEVSGFVDAGAAARVANAKNILEDFSSRLQQSVSLSPHAPYSVSKTLFSQLNEATANQLISIHNEECAAENDLYLDKTGDFLQLYKNFGIDITDFSPTGKTSMQSWLPYFNQQQSIISVHNSFTSQADIDFYNLYRGALATFFFCICVNANQYIEQKQPPIDLLRKNNCDIVIGTDSYASNRQLNLLEEMKVIQQISNGQIGLEEILKWATSNGARALQLEDKLGSFEKNKKPGIVLINQLDDLQLTPTSVSRRLL